MSLGDIPMSPKRVPKNRKRIAVISVICIAALAFLAVIEGPAINHPLKSSVVKYSAAVSEGFSAWTTAPPAAPPAHQITMPKVALVFLTRGPMPMEKIWRQFLGASPPPSSTDSSSSSSSSSSNSLVEYAWHRHFSIYVHANPEFQGYPQGSLFAGREVSDPVQVAWGQHSMIEAERKLYVAALQDPLNSHFVLLSEDSIPLYSPATTYLQLIEETRSRINACANATNPEDVNNRMLHRWQSPMAEAGLTQDLWRKSAQWSSLIRPHARLVALETTLNEIFGRECWADTDRNRFCVSDEHYIPSLLAMHGVAEEECACDGEIMHAAWPPGGFAHPKTYSREEATREILKDVFREYTRCSAGLSLQSRALRDLQRLDRELELHGGGASLELLLSKVRGYLAGSSGNTIKVMQPSCPLFARKMDADTADAWLAVLAPTLAKARQGTAVAVVDTSGEGGRI